MSHSLQPGQPGSGGQALLAHVLGRTGPDLGEVARLATQTVSAAGCLVLLADASATTLQVAATYPTPGAGTSRWSLPVGYGVIGMVAARGRAVILDDDSPRDLVHRSLLGLGEGESVARLCVPVPGLDGAVGVLALHRAPAQPFTQAAREELRVPVAALGLRLAADRYRARARESSTERDELIAQAIQAQEAERRRIAGDLHDGVTQALVSLDYHLAAALAGLRGSNAEQDAENQDGGAIDQIAAARRLSGLAYDETRAAISGLHSLILDDLGLLAALDSLAQSVTAAVEGLQVDFLPDSDDAFDAVPDHVAAAFYRIAQETVNNAVKHARASRVLVSLRRVGDLVVLAVSDDGVGFNAHDVRSRPLADGNAEHFGLSSIAERCALIGATLRIDSVQGRGTAVIVERRL